MKKLLTIIPIILILAAALTVAVFADEADAVTVTSVELNGNCDKVTVHAEATPEFLAENKEADVYLMEMKAWNGAVIPADAKPVAKTKLSDAEIKLETGFVKATDRYDSFIIAVKDSGGYLAISQARFVDDAAVFSTNTAAYPAYATKRGLISNDLSDLAMTGAAQTVIQVRADELLLPGYAPNSEAFTYCGNTYYVDRATLDALDGEVRALNGQGVNVFAQITLSGRYRGGGKLASLYFADAPDGAEAYALNTASDSATAVYTAFVDFLAGRYASPKSENGFIGSWIVGGWADTSATSARGDVSDEQYVEYYQRALRLTDTAVRSVWKNARVYVPVTNDWNTRSGGPGNTGAKVFLTALSACVKAHGDIPWRVAVSACPSDRSMAAVWTDTWATEGEDTKYISVKNVNVLADFLAKEENAYKGGARNYAVIDFAVNGSPDSPGDMTPAASFAYAYYKIAFDDRADALIWSTARDAEYAPDTPEAAVPGSGDAEQAPAPDSDGEAPGSGDTSAPGSDAAAAVPATPSSGKLYLGLLTSAGVKKPIYDVFTKIDAALPADPNYKEGDAVSFALSMIGTPDWKNVAPGYDKSAAVKYNYIESMPIMSSDISGRIKTTSSYGFASGVGSFYPVGAEYVELRTAEGPEGEKTALLYAGLPEGGGAERAGVACPLGFAASDAKYVSFQVYVEAPTDVASIAVSVAIRGSGEEKLPALFVGTATVKPNSWQEITFRCEDIASVADDLGTMSVFASSYDGLDHAGNWGMMIDDLVTYGAKTSKLLPILGKLLIAALVIIVIFGAVIFALRVRNVRRARQMRGRKPAEGGRP